jgi:hypothetical protein
MKLEFARIFLEVIDVCALKEKLETDSLVVRIRVNVLVATQTVPGTPPAGVTSMASLNASIPVTSIPADLTLCVLLPTIRSFANVLKSDSIRETPITDSMDVKKSIVFTTPTVLMIDSALTSCVRTHAIEWTVDPTEPVLFGTDRRPVVANRDSKITDDLFALMSMNVDSIRVTTQPFVTTLQEVSAASVPTIWSAMHTLTRDVMNQTFAIMETLIVQILPLVFLWQEFPNVETDAMTQLFVV